MKELVTDYFAEWTDTYRKGAVRESTLKKYDYVHRQLSIIAPNVKMCDLDRMEYQKILNEFAKTHEKTTVTGFHHLLKACVRDAFHDGDIASDPSRRAVIKGRPSKEKKRKFLDFKELQKLISDLDLECETDLLIYFIAKTGLRFSEALAVTPKDFDLRKRTVSITKSRSHQSDNLPVKNRSSVRTITIDSATLAFVRPRIRPVGKNAPIFPCLYNSTANYRLKRHCQNAKIPVITVHGLRHTHASLLLYKGVSVQSVAKRLGHADTTVTQRTYLHIISELEDRDRAKINAVLGKF